MPIVESSYVSPLLLANGHVQTLFSSLFRRVDGISYEREKLTTPDNDLLQLDWATNRHNRIAIIAHGLEGNSRRPYVLGMVRALLRNGWDAVVWNARGCGGEPNRLLRFTHSGATEDLHAVVSHVIVQGRHTDIALIGFSLGGNLTLKFLGERGSQLPREIKKAVTFSVPCDLESGSKKLAGVANRIYMRRFLKELRQKIRIKMELMPGQIDDANYERLRTFQDFDDRYTAPIHGFVDAQDYWRKSSCRPFLKNISIPTLLVNARNDPFLAPPCFPVEESSANPFLFLETPDSGGHVGFVALNANGDYWSETRAISFLC